MTDLPVKELESKRDSKSIVSDEEASTKLLEASGITSKISTAETGSNLTQAWPEPRGCGVDRRPLPDIAIEDDQKPSIDSRFPTKGIPTEAEKIELNVESREIARQIMSQNDGKFPDGAEREFIRKTLLDASKNGQKHVEYMVQRINQELKAIGGKFMLGYSYPKEETYPGVMSVSNAFFRLYDTATSKETDSVSISVVSEGPARPVIEPFRPTEPLWPVIRPRPDVEPKFPWYRNKPQD